ncbi:MAG: ribonuclease protein component [Pseudonocardiales bacterium]|nr:ribonuclease protein component [Pseudonocardiales bacterium]
MVVHRGACAPAPEHVTDQASTRATGQAAPRVGLIVGRTVGGSVERHRVSRRLRAQLAARLDRLPAGSGTVVRALPAAGAATSATLGADLDAALARLEARG